MRFSLFQRRLLESISRQSRLPVAAQGLRSAWRFPPFALCLLAVGPAYAQFDRFDGAQAPGQSYALQDDGAALLDNPAGLAFVEGLEADQQR